MRATALVTKFIGRDTDFWLTRFVFQRALGFTYLIAFWAVVRQFQPLLGERGLLPVPLFVDRVSFWQSPSIFHWFVGDAAFGVFGILGLALAILATIGISERFSTLTSASIWFGLWILYLSFVNVGQRFYSFGWETMLLEAGFVAIFLGANRSRPSVITIVLLRWILFRVMFGAGLIKLRGDACWRTLTCMEYHHETQPMPNPLSWYFHHAPVIIHRLGVVFNHVVELIVPFFYFAPPVFAPIAGLLTLLFHTILGVSGNYAFLGFLTMVLTIPVFNDAMLSKLIPIKLPQTTQRSVRHETALYLLAALFILLSIFPIVNLFSPNQAMNRSYNSFHLVNSYGAFGSVTQKRYEVIIEATMDTQVTDATTWREYEFKAKPTALARTPGQYAPYHLRLDWLAWFEGIGAGAGYEADGAYRRTPWFVHFLIKLLQADPDTLTLLESAPFGSQRPTYVRALLYQYNFTTPAVRAQTGNIWQRALVDTYVAPISLNDPAVLEAIRTFGWQK